MKFINQYSIIFCIIAAAIVLLISFASYLFASSSERTLIAIASCMFALLGIVIGLLKFDKEE
ncbi:MULTISPECIES: hypothetical protein [unclassified Ruminococcus]|uniref:hypothetical protein n=1 Tax=unclassified Ruminococcus TaxID=2608920 RepID=UPI00210BECD8|nr:MULTISPECIES: hypothetical protein [unclassified Ruminococcus]MCQ4022688.1 hypothetical protein [Ruminococcus sp. zg-924]MCQ4114928.1 hypothetical protein [Ruminococcus sp. zg-921]